MVIQHKENDGLFGPGYNYILVLLLRTFGFPVSVNQPHDALRFGTTGYAILYVAAYIIVGIPIVYLELIIGQFTSRDCIDVWKIRKCLSHIGYFLVFWQILTYTYNHMAATFVTHYFLISFENPGPYYTCDWWSKSNCDILTRNYTLNKYCLRLRHMNLRMCHDLYTTMPEYQYFRSNILGPWNYLGISWRLSLASIFTCVFLFLSCFKRMQSLKWFLYPIIIYPIFGYAILMIGTLRQKGIMTKFKESIDFSFHVFLLEYKPVRVITQVIFSIGAGTGVFINLSSNAQFRLPCFTNAVVIVLVTATFNILTVLTFSMMTCPYAKEYGVPPRTILRLPISFIFEMVPTMLYEYDNKSFYNVVLFSCQAALGLSSSLVLTFSLTQFVFNRYPAANKYPSLICLAWVLVTFLSTMPLLGKFGYSVVMHAYAYIHGLSIFFVLLEYFVFVYWYGFDRLQQDVHFMLGTPPKTYIKICWALSGFVLTFAFFRDIYRSIRKGTINDKIGTGSLGVLLGMLLLVTITKLIIAAVRGRFNESVKLNSNWGPKSELLQRSRGMFTAQAMTKEYIYRKYHLQAGIAARQKRANVRIRTI
ncbi:sodium-dependent proline transporter-like [Hyposmocoma kahamanoa]|uniref:sodium-dependent proline transporter-like n=1 Tax=Hyposmocoma kahamanoa TaxID=1477025 RepID=UPI000E6D9E7D|nr:sodium-dependent proline transporter-like [Hyposmocoma kahamanoa]